jgi:hypothetical protein
MVPFRSTKDVEADVLETLRGLEGVTLTPGVHPTLGRAKNGLENPLCGSGTVGCAECASVSQEAFLLR